VPSMSQPLSDYDHRFTGKSHEPAAEGYLA
jgi:hypothetical protein